MEERIATVIQAGKYGTCMHLILVEEKISNWSLSRVVSDTNFEGDHFFKKSEIDVPTFRDGVFQIVTFDKDLSPAKNKLTDRMEEEKQNLLNQILVYGKQMEEIYTELPGEWDRI